LDADRRPRNLRVPVFVGRRPADQWLTVEINSREHFAAHGFKQLPFGVSSRCFEGACEIPIYELDELLGTKLRALYQRKKGRDLFDLAVALAHDGVDPGRIVETFAAYMDHGGHIITRALFEQNMHQKLTDPQFTPISVRSSRPPGIPGTYTRRPMPSAPR
jgi:hypothetical protein